MSTIEFEKLYSDNVYTLLNDAKNIKIIANGKTIESNRYCLAANSSVFQQLLADDLGANHDKIVTLDEDVSNNLSNNYDILNLMISYMHNQSISFDISMLIQLMKHSFEYKFGDLYELCKAQLEKFCKKKDDMVTKYDYYKLACTLQLSDAIAILSNGIATNMHLSSFFDTVSSDKDMILFVKSAKENKVQEDMTLLKIITAWQKLYMKHLDEKDSSLWLEDCLKLIDINSFSLKEIIENKEYLTYFPMKDVNTALYNKLGMIKSIGDTFKNKAGANCKIGSISVTFTKQNPPKVKKNGVMGKPGKISVKSGKLKKGCLLVEDFGDI
jgi:hypothetical protein